MERRVVWAILLMMVIAILPAVFMQEAGPDAGTRPGNRGSDSVPAPAGPRRPAPPRAWTRSSAGPPARPHAATSSAAADTVRGHVTALYLRGQHPRRPIRTGNAADLPLHGAGRSRPGAAAPRRQRSPRRSRWCRARHARSARWAFTPSADSLNVGDGAAPLRLSAVNGAYGVGSRVRVRARRVPGGRVGAGARGRAEWRRCSWWAWARGWPRPKPTRSRTSASSRWSPAGEHRAHQLR